MATLAQLKAESWWGREITTDAMRALGDRLCTAYRVDPIEAFGIKGNEAHLKGGHRSQEWIKNSAYCKDRAYATQSGLTAEQLRLIAAFDFTPGTWGSADNRAKMRILTKRAIDAMKAGKLPELIEVFGTLDGKTVTGYRNDTDSTVTADSSHLDHLHGRLDRRFCNDPAVMRRIGDILLGDDMTPGELLGTILGSSGPNVGVALQSGYNNGVATKATVEEIKSLVVGQNAAIKALSDALAKGGTSVDTAVITKAIVDRAAEDRARDETHAAQIASLQAEIHRLTDALAAAGKAQAALGAGQ